MRRVLHLVGASEDNGGILSVIRGIASHGPATGWGHVAWMREGFRQEREPRLEVRESAFAIGESPSHLRMLASAILAYPGLSRLVRREGFDVVHGHSRGALPLTWWLARSGFPVLFTNHAYARRKGMYRRAAKGRGMVTVLLTPNQARHYGIEPRAGVVEVVSAHGADRFFEAPLRGGGWGGEGTLRLIGVGNVVRWKAWDLLVDAISRLPSGLRGRVKATIWGPVPDEPDAREFAAEVEALVKARGLEGNVRLAGPTRDVQAALGQADLFVLPSTNEPCSVALIEAMAMGLPALVSASGGNVDIVRDGETGLMFKPGLVEGLAGALERVLRGEARLATPAGVRASVRMRCAREVSARYSEIYARLAAGRR